MFFFFFWQETFSAKKTKAHRGDNKDEERISPEAPKPNKASTWSHVLKQKVICQWHHYCITIDCTCCHIYKADIKAPRSTAVSIFLQEVRGTVSKWSKHKYQCSGDPDKPISNMSKKNHNEWARKIKWKAIYTVTIRLQTSQTPKKKPIVCSFIRCSNYKNCIDLDLSICRWLVWLLQNTTFYDLQLLSKIYFCIYTKRNRPVYLFHYNGNKRKWKSKLTDRD